MLAKSASSAAQGLELAAGCWDTPAFPEPAASECLSAAAAACASLCLAAPFDNTLASPAEATLVEASAEPLLAIAVGIITAGETEASA